MWEPKLWYHLVTPRSRGYRDVIVTYIRRVKIPHIYAKHQYRQESEYKSMVVIYIPVIIAQVHSYHRAWYNIPRIWDHQEAQKQDMQYKKTKKILTSNKKRISWANQRCWKKRDSRQTTANPRFHRALWLAIARPPRSRLLNLDMKVHGYQKVTQQVHKIKPVGVFKQSHVYMIEWCGSGIQVQAMTSKINRNRRISTKFEIK